MENPLGEDYAGLVLMSTQTGERGATVRLFQQTEDGRHTVEVVGSDGVTEAFYPNLTLKDALEQVKLSLYEDTEAYLVEQRR